MNISINNFIDFTSLFEVIFKEQHSDLEEEKYVADHYRYILDFRDDFSNFKLLKEECEVLPASIIFVFYKETFSANESNPDSDGTHVTIVYDKILDEFVSCDFE